MREILTITKEKFNAFKKQHGMLLYRDKILISLKGLDTEGNYLVSFGEGMSENAYTLYEDFKDLK